MALPASDFLQVQNDRTLIFRATGEAEILPSTDTLSVGNECSDSPSSQAQLPPEVLGQIFEASTAPGLSVECMKLLIDLCLVCKSWREAALAHHPLWSSLEVKVRFTPRVYDKIQSWFARAGTVPKSLAIHSSYHQYCWFESDEVANDEAAFGESGFGIPCDFAAPDLARQLLSGTSLDHLSLYCPSTTCLIYLTMCLRTVGETTPWDNLRSLRIVINCEWVMDEESQEAVDVVFQTLPPVKSLHIHVPGYKYHTHPNSPWAEGRRLTIAPTSLSRLTRLAFGCDWHYRTVFDTIRPCINLQVLTLHLQSSTLGYNETNDSASSQFSPDPVKDVSFPRLEVLRLRQANPVAIRILRHFETPVLTELDIGFKVAGFSWDASGTLDGSRWQDYVGLYVSRSNCRMTVRVLRLEGVTMSKQLFRDLVADCFPRLTGLTLDGVSLKGESPLQVLQGLTAGPTGDPSSTPELPHLQTVRLLNLPPSPSTVLGTPVVIVASALGAVTSPLRANGCECRTSHSRSKVQFVTICRDGSDPPQLEDEYGDWTSEDPEEEEGFDSWDFNLGVRESLLHTLEHDYL